VTLAIDIMENNKIPFMVSTSRNIHFGTAELIHDKTNRKLIISIQQIKQAYHAKGFHVTTILADGAFECIRNNLAEMGISLKSHQEMNMSLK